MRFPRDCGSSFPRPDPAGSPFFQTVSAWAGWRLWSPRGSGPCPAVHELDIVLFALPVVEKQVPHNPAVIQQGVVDCPLIPQQTFPVLFLPKIVREAEVVKFYDFLHPFSSQFLQLHRFHLPFLWFCQKHHHSATIGAKMPPIALARSSGRASICKPILPPLTTMVSCCFASSSKAVAKRFFIPIGEHPPRT